MTRCLGCMTEYDEQYDVCPHCGYVAGTPASEALHMEPGCILRDRYIVGKVLGFGGFGVTYIGWDALLEQVVAIKEYLPSEFSTRIPGQTQVTVFNDDKQEQFSEGLTKFVDEAQRLAQFHNTEGIVRIFDSFEDNGTAYIIMEYLDGETLKTYLEENGPIAPEDAIDMLMPVMESLKIVNEAGIIHRDIAPDNIFLTRDGRVKLIDFGAARYATTTRSRSLTVIIKPGFSPEEQYRSRGDQGPWTDVYAIGATLYRMITGKTPPDALERRAMFEGKKKDILKPLSRFREGIPPNTETAILNALNVRIEDRSQDMSELIGELTSEETVKRKAGKIKKIDVLKWPLWAKIGVPAAAALVITLTTLFFTGVIGFDDMLQWGINIPDGMSRVPSVISNTVVEAEERLNEATLLYQITGKEFSSLIPADLVLTQNLNAGSVVASNSMLDVTISGGAELRVVPNVEGLSSEEAQAALEEAGFAVHTEEAFSDSVAAGSVISQDQKADSEFGLGETITITVSKGFDPSKQGEQKMTKVPNFVGKSYNDALAAAKQAGFLLNVKSKAYSTEYDKDIVMTQSVAAGSEIMSGNTIDLVVSLGKQAMRVPDVQYREESEARQLLTEQGLQASVSYQKSDTVAAGVVISQNPAAKTSVAPGAAVKLVVSEGSASFSMPNVVGQSESSATSTLSGKGLSVSVSYEKSDKAEGTVLKQSVASGSAVNRGDSVTITVSSGQPTVSVANVVGKSESDAKSTLQNQALKTSSSEAYSDTVAKGNVISQSPSAGSTQTAGTTIVLTVSKGKEPVTVPDVVGRSRSNAESALSNLGLKFSVSEEYDDTIASGNVISQNPSSGRSANVGDTVTLKVSKGKEPITVPNVVNQTKPNADSTLKGKNLKVAYADEQYSATVASGSVISQSPTSGTTAYKGDTVTLTVSKGKPPNPVTNFSISGAGSVMEGKTLQLSVTSVQPADADDKTPSWESKNTNIATVSASGLVSGKAPGSATIQAKIGTVTKECTITVTEIPKYTITFNANGGSNMTPTSQIKTQDLPLTLTSNTPTPPAAITITYNTNGGSAAPSNGSITKSFSGWKATDGTTYPSSGAYSKNEATTMTAQWTTNNPPFPPTDPTKSYTVTFNYGSGSGSPANRTVSCTLNGWYTSSSGGTKITSITAISSNTTLYAQWANPTISTLPTVTAPTGYTFKGWYDTSNGGNSVTSSTGVSSDRTIYAQYDPLMYTVSYNANGGSGAPGNQTKTHGVTLTLSSTKPTKTGYTITLNANGGSVSPATLTSSINFSSWSGSDGNSYQPSGNFTTNANTTLTAQWGSASSVTLPTPTRAGYTFNGWYTASSSGTKVGNAGASYTATGSLTLYAQWTEIPTYPVSFSANGGSGAPSSQTKTHDVNLTLSSTKPIKTYTITYNANGGSVSPSSKSVSCTFSSWQATDGATYSSGGTYSKNAATTMTAQWTNPAAGTLATPTRAGYTFRGWYESTIGSNDEVKSSTIVTMNVTLYAQWNAIPTYTVSYDANGGSGAPSSQTKTQDITLTLTSSTPSTAKSYTITYNANGGSVSPGSKSVSCSFDRWNTSSNGSGSYYSKGASYTANSNATLYAIWTNPIAGTLATPTRSGYSFSGWFTATSGGNQVTSSTTITGNTTIYAQWKADDFVIVNGVLQKYQGTDTNVTIPSSVTTIGKQAFQSTSVRSVTIPNSVTRIEEDAFYNCVSLNSVSIPNTVTYIGTNAFSLTNLSSITIPNSVTSMGGGWNFQSCSNLRSVTLSNKLTSLAPWMFYGCSSLTSITIPSSVTYIDEMVFRGCNINSLYFQGNAPQVHSSAFYGVSRDAIVYYKSGTTGWGSRWNNFSTATW